MRNLTNDRNTIQKWCDDRNLDVEILNLNDPTPYLSIDITDEEESYVSFDLYANSDTVSMLDSDSADLKTRVQTELFPIL